MGYALYALPPNTDVPWQRVVNGKCEISRRSFDRGDEMMQRILLEGEGVIFGENGRIALKHYLSGCP